MVANMNLDGPWPDWLPKSPEHILNGVVVVCWVECCSINSLNGWSVSICCCVRSHGCPCDPKWPMFFGRYTVQNELDGKPSCPWLCTKTNVAWSNRVMLQLSIFVLMNFTSMYKHGNYIRQLRAVQFIQENEQYCIHISFGTPCIIRTSFLL